MNEISEHGVDSPTLTTFHDWKVWEVVSNDFLIKLDFVLNFNCSLQTELYTSSLLFSKSLG
jgi:hypothetical protein